MWNNAAICVSTITVGTFSNFQRLFSDFSSFYLKIPVEIWTFPDFASKTENFLLLRLELPPAIWICSDFGGKIQHQVENDPSTRKNFDIQVSQLKSE